MSIAKIESGRFTIDIASLLDASVATEKRHLAEVLSCDSDIFDHVAAQIIEKWTENDYQGPYSHRADLAPFYGLDKAWRDVAKKSSDIAKSEIERLEAALSASRDENMRLRTENSVLRDSLRTARGE